MNIFNFNVFAVLTYFTYVSKIWVLAVLLLPNLQMWMNVLLIQVAAIRYVPIPLDTMCAAATMDTLLQTMKLV